MPNIFADLPKVRIRFESAGHSSDFQGPCGLVVHPSQDGSGRLFVAEQHASLPQLAALVEAVVRYGIQAGVMQEALAAIASAPTESTMRVRNVDPNTPPDDRPQHLRGG